jgi:hypothetical protein
MTTALLQPQAKVTKNGIEWTASKATVGECLKCGGNGKYYYQDRSVGQCYCCSGLGLVIGGEKPSLEKHQKEIYSIHWNEEKQQVTIYYICKDSLTTLPHGRKLITSRDVPKQGKTS